MDNRSIPVSVPDLEIEEINIQDIIGGYYSFFQSFVHLRDIVDTAHNIGDDTRENLYDVLDSIEGKHVHHGYHLYVSMCTMAITCM